MLELIINFTIGLAVVGIPSYVFYKLGMDTGIERGEKRQILKDLMSHGVIEQADQKKRSDIRLFGRLMQRR